MAECADNTVITLDPADNENIESFDPADNQSIESLDPADNQNIESEESDVETSSVLPRHETLTIFVVGRTGVGKSTLINSLLGDTIDERARVANGPDPCKHELIEEHRGSWYGIPTVMYDTRGLGDPEINTKAYKMKFKEKFRQCDRFLVFICQRFTGKHDDSVKDFAKLLSKKFKKNYNIWRNSILVLTRADEFQPLDDEDKELDEDAKRVLRETIMAEWGLKFKQCFEKYGVPEEVIEAMPVCIAGRKKETPANPVTENWIEILLKTCRSTNQDKSLYTMQKETEKAAAKKGVIIGGAAGGVIIPVFGAPIGMTVGYLVGLKLGREAVIKKAKEEGRQRRRIKILRDLEKPGRFSFLKFHPK